MKQRLDLCC